MDNKNFLLIRYRGRACVNVLGKDAPETKHIFNKKNKKQTQF